MDKIIENNRLSAIFDKQDLYDDYRYRLFEKSMWFGIKYEPMTFQEWLKSNENQLIGR